MKRTIKIAEIPIILNFTDKRLRTIIDSLYSAYIINNTKNLIPEININLEYKGFGDNNEPVQKLNAFIDNDFINFKFIKIDGKYNFIKKEGSFQIEDSPIAFYSLFRVILSYSMAFFDGFYLHSSSVFNDNNGLIATGISGAGKSTFATTLSKQGFKIIHDDLTLVRKINGVFKIFSLPFINDPRFVFESNVNIKLTHLFFLGKSEKNFNKEMSKKEIYKTFMRMILSFSDIPSLFYDKYLLLIEDLINQVKISKLSYNPKTLEIKDFI